MHPMLNTAIKAARRAGSIINRASIDLDRIQVSRKGPRDYVTEVDRAAEEAIIDVLRTAYPDHAFLGEESGQSGQSGNGKACCDNGSRKDGTARIHVGLHVGLIWRALRPEIGRGFSPLFKKTCMAAWHRANKYNLR